MAEAAQPAYHLIEISPECKTSGLSLGQKDLLPLKMFLKKDAFTHHQQNVGKTYVFVNDDKKVMAYITLTCSQIELLSPPQGLDGFTYKDYPAVKIGKLAVDQSVQKAGLGRKLVEFSIAVVRERIMPHVGCRFIAVDSYQGAIDFYARCGFRLLETDANKSRKAPLMFIDLGKLE